MNRADTSSAIVEGVDVGRLSEDGISVMNMVFIVERKGLEEYQVFVDQHKPVIISVCHITLECILNSR